MKIGILGCGRIAEVVAPTLVAMPEIECWACATRDSLERAQAFADKHGFAHAYGTYEEMLCDKELELVYICTPHSHHYEHIIACLDHGKHVICEKSFTLNTQQAQWAISYAKDKKLYLAEAIWTRYMPSRAIIQNVLDSGAIGEVYMLTANLCYAEEEKERILDPKLAGGALLDLGVYGLNFALMHRGEDIERIESSVRMTKSGVDGQECIQLIYRDGDIAILTHSISCRSDRQGVFYGDKGYMVVENINNPQSLRVYDTDDNLLREIKMPEQISGYEYEFREAVQQIKAGQLESASMPLKDTIRVMGLMDHIRATWGLQYPGEKK